MISPAQVSAQNAGAPVYYPDDNDSGYYSPKNYTGGAASDNSYNEDFWAPAAPSPTPVQSPTYMVPVTPVAPARPAVQPRGNVAAPVTPYVEDADSQYIAPRTAWRPANPAPAAPRAAAPQPQPAQGNVYYGVPPQGSYVMPAQPAPAAPPVYYVPVQPFPMQQVPVARPGTAPAYAPPAPVYGEDDEWQNDKDYQIFMGY